MTDRIATPEPREEGFYWVVLGQNPRDRLLGAGRVVARRRRAAVATGGGDRAR
jgi:hypothetical protein